MEPVDWNALRENCAGDESLVNEVIELFRKEGDGLLGDVKAAVQAQDGLAIKRSAHRLKGALVSLAAQPCVAAARELELCGAENRLQSCPETYQRLEHEMKRLLTALASPVAA
jgi:HPt (histidine-containing phosphotransfer) domain-containing protein